MFKFLPLWDYGITLGLLYFSFRLHSILKVNSGALQFFAVHYRWLLLTPSLPVFLNALLGLYSERSRSVIFNFTRLPLSSILTFFAFTTTIFYARVLDFPRLIILLWIITSFPVLYAIRVPLLHKQSHKRIFILYNGNKHTELLRYIRQRNNSRGKIIGSTNVDNFTKEEFHTYLRRIIDDFKIDVFCLLLEPLKRNDIITLLRQEGVQYDLHGTIQLLEETCGQTKLFFADLIDYTEILKNNTYLAFKEILDRGIAAIFLLLLSPLFAIIALAIRIDSPGPTFYRQKRVGKNGRTFELYKFRTMIPDAERHTGPMLALENDPRITRIGKILRKTRLDELPQLWNVLKGEMSLIGPRPERPEFVEQWKALIPYYDHRLLVKPGITGWAQVLWKYDEGPETVSEKLEYDLYYLRHCSLSLDLEILARTVLVMLFGKGAR